AMSSVANPSVLVSAPTFFTNHRCRLGESPVWDERAGRLLWCDIPACEILSADEQGRDQRRWSFPDRVASFGLCESGRWGVALAHGVHLFDPVTGALSQLADPE